ncbi:MAG: hypothetical protein ACI9U2_004909, partial [Bradymonadia bacterium]
MLESKDRVFTWIEGPHAPVDLVALTPRQALLEAHEVALELPATLFEFSHNG